MAVEKPAANMSVEAIQSILDIIPEQFHDGVLDGTLVVKVPEMWYNPLKPVIAGAKDNHIKHGRYITANNPGMISKQTAYKRKASYKELQGIYIGGEPNEHEKQLISLKEIIEALWDAANGSKQLVACPHPELHPPGSKVPLEHVVAFKKDPNALFKLYENLVGKAGETMDVNINQSALVRMLQDPTPVSNLVVIDLPPDQAYEKRQLIEGQFTDIPNGNS